MVELIIILILKLFPAYIGFYLESMCRERDINANTFKWSWQTINYYGLRHGNARDSCVKYTNIFNIIIIVKLVDGQTLKMSESALQTFDENLYWHYRATSSAIECCGATNEHAATRHKQLIVSLITAEACQRNTY